MSWLRSALNKAAEVGGKNIAPNLRTVRSYAGNVYQQAGHAVAGGAKLVQDRLVGKRLNNLKSAIKRLDEVSLNVRGPERLLALERWLSALKDIDDSSKRSFTKTNVDGVERAPVDKLDDEETNTSPRKAPKVSFVDNDAGGQPANFRDVFLRSHALENIVTSLIMSEPQDEEISMLRGIFRFCLAGGQELHIALISSIQDLARAFSSQMDEIMVKKSQLLQLVRDAITGLKLNSEAERLDAEIFTLQTEIADKNKQLGIGVGEDTVASLPPTSVSPTRQEDASNPEGLEITQEILRLSMDLRRCIEKKQRVLHSGDTLAGRDEKILRLKEVSAALQNSITIKKKEIADNKLQQEKALQYRQTKVQETLEMEKAVATEVRALEKRRLELEAELKEVKAALASATLRHINIQEEKEQFDDASSNIIGHLSQQEQELSRSITFSTGEATIVGTWVSFLEDTWVLQSAYLQEKDKDFKRTFQEGRHQLVNAATNNLLFHEKHLEGLLQHLRSTIVKLKMMNDKGNHFENPQAEEIAGLKMESAAQLAIGYQEAETQVIHTFDTLLRVNEEVRLLEQEIDETEVDLFQQVHTAFDAISKLQEEFKALERPEALLSRIILSQGSPEPPGSLETTLHEREHEVHKHPPDGSNELQGAESLHSVTSEMDSPAHKNADTAQSGLGLDNEGWELDELEEALNTPGLG